MNTDMFCYQCEQTAGSKGCTKVGVCGKTPEVANLQDLLIYQLKGISSYAVKLINSSKPIDKDIVSFVENCLFTTLTNVNFDVDNHVALLKQSQSIKEKLHHLYGDDLDCKYANYTLSASKEEMLKDAKMAGIMYDDTLDQDIRSLRSTILYGLKGVAAYGHQARELKYVDDDVDNFYFKALHATTDDSLKLNDLIQLTLDTGNASLKVMKLLDAANTEIYNHPVPTKVNTGIKRGPFIIVSGHDLKDLEMLLIQTEGKGINIYTHGEMLPCHGYPALKKYKHLVGNFGSAWQNQQSEFDNIPGCILMTTNCLMKPRDSYKDRIFTTNVVGFDGLQAIDKDKDGNKDFTKIINKALELKGFDEDKPDKEILVGFARNATLENAGAIVDAVKSKQIRHFFLVGGCDGARPGRNYFTNIAKQIPDDCVILTLACGKYRFNKLDFGDIGGIPRLLDVGQCNDAHSAIKIALALADAFGTDVNGLPLSIILSWYEQKAVADLLALLALNIQNIYIGPTLPAFLSPNVTQFLVDTFKLTPISTPEDDLKTILG